METMCDKACKGHSESSHLPKHQNKLKKLSCFGK